MKTPVAIVAMTAVTLALMTPPASADAGGSCHFHGSKPARAETVTGCALQRKALLIKQGKLEASWESTQPGAPEQVDGKKGKEWKLRFDNPGAADKSKQTLYMFFTLSGNFIAANFTGQ
jgi:hypothetical protein